MMSLILYTFVTACLASFIVSLAEKWGAVEWVQVHGNDFFAKMFSCRFCLSWWAGVAVAAVIVMVTGDVSLLLCPFLSTNLTKKML